MSQLRTRRGLFDRLGTVCLAFLLAGCIPQSVAPPNGAPAGLAAVPGNAIVTLSWSAVSGATGYSVRRSTTGGGPYSQIATTASPGYADSSVANGTAYYYVVSAYNDGGGSGNSAEVSATPAVPTVPAVPGNVAVSAGDGRLSITWTGSANTTSYRVKRATVSGGPYSQIASPAAAPYVDTPLTNGTTYYYVISAVNAVGESANSAQVSGTPSPPPPTTFGTWTNVTPAGVNPADAPCGFPGASSIQADPAHPSNLYLQIHCQGIWKSVDYGATWTGPINTGTNGASAGSCDGVIAISPTSTAAVPTIYQACVRGVGTGFWKSPDGGVNWVHYTVNVTVRQDYLHPVIDPYDQNHILMSGHEFDSLVESLDGGQTWRSINVANGMLSNGVNSYIEFIDTGTASTTRGTWLWMGEGGGTGTWRTTDSGATWTKVNSIEVYAASPQIYQPNKTGTLFIAGSRSSLGEGVLRSPDYGLTWSHVGISTTESVVFGSSKNVYSMCNCSDGSFQVASQPGTGTWVAPGTAVGPVTPLAAQVAVVNDGTHNILVGAMWDRGVWRYVEP